MPDQPWPSQQPNGLIGALERRIQARTYRSIRFLRVDHEEGVVRVHGCTHTYHSKQLALAAVREVVPEAPVELDIEVVPMNSRPFLDGSAFHR